MSDTLIEAAGLSAGYGKMAVVRDLDLHVDAGEVVALIGANGAGKTTTLLTLAGELTPMTGEVRFLGKPTTAPMHVRCRNGLGYVTEERSVIMDMSVADNLKLAGVVAGGRVRATSRRSSGSMDRRAGLLLGRRAADAVAGTRPRSRPEGAARRRAVARAGADHRHQPPRRRSATRRTSGASACSSSSNTSARRSRSPIACYVMERGTIALSGPGGQDAAANSTRSRRPTFSSLWTRTTEHVSFEVSI